MAGVSARRIGGARSAVDVRLTAAQRDSRWQALADQFLPLEVEGSTWRASRRPTATDPSQGWKLHVSATTLSACDVLAAVAPPLLGRRALFKAPATLAVLQELNCGLIHGYSQVGKFITIYPRSDSEAVELAEELHRLTLGMAAPRVPSDLAYASESCVHYRYGSFIGPLGNGAAPGIRTLDGHEIPDEREPGHAVPAWATDPFAATKPRAPRQRATALRTTYRVYEALSRRGKGGVYRALDLSLAPARLSILKEGRRHGEVDWEGRDGFARVQREARVLTGLRAAGIPVPEVYGTFVAGGNFYVAMEALDGANLHQLATDGLSASRALNLSIRLADLVGRIHAAGWVWNDCKPLNVIASADGLRPLDFEGAARLGRRSAWSWGSAAYLPPEIDRPRPDISVAGDSQADEGVDLHALGISIWQLHKGRLPSNAAEVQDPSHLDAPVHDVVRRLVGEGVPITAAEAVRLLRAQGEQTA